MPFPESPLRLGVPLPVPEAPYVPTQPSAAERSRTRLLLLAAAGVGAVVLAVVLRRRRRR